MEEKMNVLDGLYYTEEHEWIKFEDGAARVGITDFAQHALGDVVYVELPEIGEGFAASEIFGAVESSKAASDLNMPISGTVTERNEALEDDPSLINKDAYASWIIVIEPTNPGEKDKLLTADAYREFLKECEE
jgi:glycine cleavage system H protein